MDKIVDFLMAAPLSFPEEKAKEISAKITGDNLLQLTVLVDTDKREAINFIRKVLSERLTEAKDKKAKKPKVLNPMIAHGFNKTGAGPHQDPQGEKGRDKPAFDRKAKHKGAKNLDEAVLVEDGKPFKFNMAALGVIPASVLKAKSANEQIDILYEIADDPKTSRDDAERLLNLIGKMNMKLKQRVNETVIVNGEQGTIVDNGPNGTTAVNVAGKVRYVTKDELKMMEDVALADILRLSGIGGGERCAPVAQKSEGFNEVVNNLIAVEENIQFCNIGELPQILEMIRNLYEEISAAQG